MKQLIDSLEDEIEFINVCLSRYTDYLSNESMKMLGQRKEVLQEMCDGCKSVIGQFEKEARNSGSKKKSKSSGKVVKQGTITATTDAASGSE